MNTCFNFSLILNAPRPAIFIRKLKNIQGSEFFNSDQVKLWCEKPPSYLLKVKIRKKLAFKPHAGTQLITRAAEHSGLVFSSECIDPMCLHIALECCRASFAPTDMLAALSPVQDPSLNLCTNLQNCNSLLSLLGRGRQRGMS